MIRLAVRVQGVVQGIGFRTIEAVREFVDEEEGVRAARAS